ncbi:hypothetical protein ABFS83_06G157100 [Erythranthe nasuta]
MKLALSWVQLVVVVCLSAYATAILPLPRKVRCRAPLPLRSRCLVNVFFLCPLECPQTCLMDCIFCKPVCVCNIPGAFCQDPRFVGGDGITFYFHGKKNQDFCLVSDSNLHINAHFIGKRNPNLKRDFTWVQSMGIMFDNHKMLIAAKTTSTWDDNIDRLSISFDNDLISLPTKVGSKWDSKDNINNRVTISRTSDTNGVIVEVGGNFRVTVNVVPITKEESKVHGYGITEDDCFAHLEVAFKFYNLSDAVDGVLGQTYRRNYESKINVNTPMPVMGGAHKYRTSGIFATNCMVSRFGKISTQKEIVAQKMGLEGLKCTSGMQGKGLVCKN